MDAPATALPADDRPLMGKTSLLSRHSPVAVRWSFPDPSSFLLHIERIKDMPRFTIGIPTYNRCDLLANALRAAVGQSFPDPEILVCDDASTDRTPEVVRSFGDRVRYHRNATNIGMWPNFAKAVELAEGEYFSW